MLSSSRGIALLGAFAVFTSLARADEPRVVVTGTRLPLPEEESPAAVTTLRASDLAERQIDSVAEALREAPGLDVVQTGTPGQVTSVFTRGLKSEHTQVLLDGIPINQGLGGLFNFADLTTTGLARIEVQRGPQSTLYGPRALAGAIQLFSARGDGTPHAVISAEVGSFGTFRERAAASGKIGDFDFLVGASRFDTDNERPNNQYRALSFLGNFGWVPKSVSGLRLGLLVTASRDDAGNPNDFRKLNPPPDAVFVPEFRPSRNDNLLTKRLLLAPSVEWKLSPAVKVRAVVSYDREEQVNDPNDQEFNNGAPNPSKAVFRRTQVDLQSDFEVARWLTVTAGGYYGTTRAERYSPLPSFDARYLFDRVENEAGFLQLTVRPFPGALLVAGARVDHFDIATRSDQDPGFIPPFTTRSSETFTEGTWRVAGSYVVARTQTTLRASYATGFAPATPQDRLFRSNFSDALNPERSRGFDAGFEQPLAFGKMRFGANWFYNHLSNVIGFDGNFSTLNLGRARTQGVEAFVSAEPIEGLTLRAAYTYLDARRTNGDDISQPNGARLPRRARNTFTASAAYRFYEKKVGVGADVRFVNGREELNFGRPNSDVGDYAVARVWTNWQVTPRVKLTARIENVFDRKYEEVPGYPSLRRGFYGGAEWKF